MVYIIDPQSAGISGNMIIGALVDLGADEDKVKNLMEDVAFDFGEVEVSLSKVMQHFVMSKHLMKSMRITIIFIFQILLKR